jgi:Apea-like HEPN
MANFNELERALRKWVNEAVARLSDAAEIRISPGLPRWQRDADGVFRKGERPARLWYLDQIETLRELPSWRAVGQALQEGDRLRVQLDQLVGTIQGGSQLGREVMSQHVLPLPDEASDLDRAFARRYGELDRFLAADEIEYLVIWPLPGLSSSAFPITLEQGIEIDIMSDKELTAVLNTEVLSLVFPQLPVLPPEQAQQACLRYRYCLPKVIGNIDPKAHEQLMPLEERINGIRDTLEQVLALLFTDPVAISGRASFPAEWIPYGGGIGYQQVPLSQAERFRRMDLDQQASAELVETWRQLRQPGLLQKQKALALALRRLSYQAHRQRIEDEMVDVMVAAEALYLSDLGPEELGFRLALRASALSDPQKLGMTRRNVFDLMKSAYSVRSKIVHGDEPRPKDLKVKGIQVPLAEFVQATEEVVSLDISRVVR